MALIETARNEEIITIRGRIEASGGDYAVWRIDVRDYNTKISRRSLENQNSISVSFWRHWILLENLASLEFDVFDFCI